MATKLEQTATRYAKLNEDVSAARTELHSAIVEALKAGWRPKEIGNLVGYDRQHIDRIRRSAKLPPTRAATVQRIPKEQ